MPPEVRNARTGEDTIKGVFVRCHESHGVVMLAFFDVRHAKAAKGLLCAQTVGPLAECVGEELNADGVRDWLTCRFVSAEDLAQVNSASSDPF